MRLRPVSLALLAVFVLTSGRVHAQMLPPPRVVPGVTYSPQMVLPPHGKPIPTLPLAASPYPPPGYQPSAYQVWQNYGVTYNGWLRPRVIQTVHGGYFLYNGAPYPYVYTMQGYQMPSVAPTGAPGP